MAKTAIPVDKIQLIKAIAEVEGENGVEGGLVALAKLVADRYNIIVNPDKPITHSVVSLRIREWNLTVKTKAGKRGRGKMTEEQKRKMAEGRAAGRTSKADKFKDSPLAQEHFVTIRKRTPERFHPIIDQIENGSRTAAVKLHCLECSNFVTSEVRLCVCSHCPLYLFRPYQGSLTQEEQDEQNQDEQEQDQDESDE